MIAMQHRALGGSPDCGDQVAVWEEKSRGKNGGLTCCVVDGLGHGLHAKQAACNILHYVANHRTESPEQLFRGCDAAMRNERGGVMAVAWIAGNQLTYASVGNISGYLVHVDARQGYHRLDQLHMDRGMIGGGYKKLNVQQLTLNEDNLLIMHSDGVNPLYNLEPWQAVLDDSDQLAVMLLQDQSKETDDACVLVYRHQGVMDDT